jgi:large subunit ribosomal protein L9
MQDKVFSLPMKCGEGGRLYGAVTSMDVASAIAKAGYKVDKRGITVTSHIKTIGEFDVEVKLHTKVTTKVKIKVIEAEK